MFLSPLSALYSSITRARLAAYERNLLHVYTLEVPVISVGNLTTGGTGKTPLVEWIARKLANESREVWVLTRGYGRNTAEERVLVSNGGSVLSNERDAGDEAFLLAQNLRNLASVVCDADRVAAGRWVLEEFKVDVFILDDGFQHLRLARNLNILTIDATNPWGGGKLLPIGRLREPTDGIRRADCVVITRTDQSQSLSSLKKEISCLGCDRSIFLSQMKTTGIRLLSSQVHERQTALPEPVAAFCAVGNPASFFYQISSEGYEIAFTKVFPDHHSYTSSEVKALVREAQRQGARSLITSAKDAVKLRSFSMDLPCYVLEIEIEIEESDGFTSLIRNSISS